MRMTSRSPRSSAGRPTRMRITEYAERYFVDECFAGKGASPCTHLGIVSVCPSNQAVHCCMRGHSQEELAHAVLK